MVLAENPTRRHLMRQSVFIFMAAIGLNGCAVSGNVRPAEIDRSIRNWSRPCQSEATRLNTQTRCVFKLAQEANITLPGNGAITIADMGEEKLPPTKKVFILDGYRYPSIVEVTCPNGSKPQLENRTVTCWRASKKLLIDAGPSFRPEE
jgi:hypothetical protein